MGVAVDGNPPRHGNRASSDRDGPIFSTTTDVPVSTHAAFGDEIFCNADPWISQREKPSDGSHMEVYG